MSADACTSIYRRLALSLFVTGAQSPVAFKRKSGEAATVRPTLLCSPESVQGSAVPTLQEVKTTGVCCQPQVRRRPFLGCACIKGTGRLGPGSLQGLCGEETPGIGGNKSQKMAWSGLCSLPTDQAFCTLALGGFKGPGPLLIGCQEGRKGGTEGREEGMGGRKGGGWKG